MNQLIVSHQEQDQIGFDRLPIDVEIRIKKDEMDFKKVRRCGNIVHVGHYTLKLRTQDSDYVLSNTIDTNGNKERNEYLAEQGHSISHKCAVDSSEKGKNYAPAELMLCNDIRWRGIWRRIVPARIWSKLESTKNEILRLLKEKLPDSEPRPWRYLIGCVEICLDIVTPPSIQLTKLQQVQNQFQLMIDGKPAHQELNQNTLMLKGTKIGKGKKRKTKYHLKGYCKEIHPKFGNVNRLEIFLSGSHGIKGFCGLGNSFTTLAEFRSLLKALFDHFHALLRRHLAVPYQITSDEVQDVIRDRIRAWHPKHTDQTIPLLMENKSIRFDDDIVPAYKLREGRAKKLLVNVDEKTFVLNPDLPQQIQRELQGGRHA